MFKVTEQKGEWLLSENDRHVWRTVDALFSEFFVVEGIPSVCPMQEAQVNGSDSSVGTCMLHVCNDALMSEEKIFQNMRKQKFTLCACAIIPE